jgi:hypothetical protein
MRIATGPAAEGRAPHARKRDLAYIGGSPHWATGLSFAPDGYVMPRLEHSLAIRARRPRPSEKIAFRAISGLSPLGDAHCDWPRRGGAGSARPQGVLKLRPGISPLGPPGGKWVFARSWSCLATALGGGRTNLIRVWSRWLIWYP